jgi:hypothetical protein
MWSRAELEKTQTSCGVLKSVKLIDCGVWKDGEHRVAAAVGPRDDVGQHETAAAKMALTHNGNVRDLLLKSELGIQQHSEITHCTELT